MVQNLHKDKRVISLEFAREALLKKALLYDKDGEEHYNLISALHKSLRGSDPDAALYWLGRMLAAGEDPLYIARRMIRFASEDIGNADPQALIIAVAAQQAFHFIGLPEGELALAQAAVYLATAPKSNSLYVGYGKVKETINTKGYLPVPLHIRNAPTKLMKELDYGKDYKYAHNYADAYVPQEYLPEEIKGQIFYQPRETGFEKTIKGRINAWRQKNNHVKMNRFIPFRFQRITRRQGGGSAGVFSYVEEADADDAANKVSQRKRKGIAKKEKGGLVRASQ
jgi:putative ATPase